jgi:hypothetical protein
MSELISQMREAFQSLVKPDLDRNDLPPVPDVNSFLITQGDACSANNKAIFIDIEEVSNSLVITLCSLLEFDFHGSLDADGLLDSVSDAVTLKVDSTFHLKAALSLGTKITVDVNNLSNVDVQLDPINAQLLVDSDLHAELGLGLIKADLQGYADLEGVTKLAYCPSPCSPPAGLSQVGNSSFYYEGVVSYDIAGGIDISGEVMLQYTQVLSWILINLFFVAGIPGITSTTGLEMRIRDNNIFDEIGPSITYPDSQALRDSIKFSPQNAVNMLALVDAWLAQASNNKAFDVNIPLLDTSFSKVLSIASVFTDKLYEFFVKAEDFAE